MKIDVALEMDGAGKELSSPDYNPAALRGMASSNGLLEGLCAVRLVVPDSAKLSNVKIALGKNRRLDARQNGRQPRPWVFPVRAEPGEAGRHWRGGQRRQKLGASKHSSASGQSRRTQTLHQIAPLHLLHYSLFPRFHK